MNSLFNLASGTPHLRPKIRLAPDTAGSATSSSSSLDTAELGPGWKLVLDAEGVARAIENMAQQLDARFSAKDELLLLGIQKGGVLICHALVEALKKLSTRNVLTGSLDVSFYRDDLSSRLPLPEATSLPDSIDGRTVILVDDVLYSGRTVRAAIDALNDYGRPGRIQLATLVDRGHRELPIAPDYVGLILSTTAEQRVRANLQRVIVSI